MAGHRIPSKRLPSMRTRRYLYLLVASIAVLAWIGLLMWHAVIVEQPYARIEPYLFVGSRVESPPPGTRAVVNLIDTEDPYEVDHTLWVPIDGSKEPSMEWLRKVVVFIDKHRQSKELTYVHCLAGMNRSGMVVTAYLMYEHGWTCEEALAFVRIKRPQIQPNPILMRCLAKWDAELRK